MLDLLNSDGMRVYLEEALELERRKFRFDSDDRRKENMPAEAEILARAAEIGRASCRERV